MKFEHWTTKKGDTFWHLRTENGDILCASDRLRQTADALQAIGSVRAGVAHAPVVQIDDPNSRQTQRKTTRRKAVKPKAKRKPQSKTKPKARKVKKKPQKK